MRLLELVTGPQTRTDAIETITTFCDVHLGKGVVKCHDRPGFIANRLGVFWLQCGINEAIKHNIAIEVADAVMSKPVGIPKTGIFGLVDLVGIDLMPHLAKSLLSSLPEKDMYRDIYQDYGFIHGMIDAGYTGRKGKGGLYRLDPEAKKRTKQALSIDKDTFDESAYAKANKPSLPSINAGKAGLRAVVTSDDEGGRYAWKVLSQTLVYAASLVPEIADDIVSVDEAMKLGYNRKQGPFEMIDALGPHVCRTARRRRVTSPRCWKKSATARSIRSKTAAHTPLAQTKNIMKSNAPMASCCCVIRNWHRLFKTDRPLSGYRRWRAVF